MDFYYITDGVSRSWLYAHRDDEMELPWEELYRGKGLPNGPLEFEVSSASGDKPGDIMSADHRVLLVSQRILDVLESVSATGYRPHPAVLRHPVVPITIHGYHALFIQGNGGPIDDERSKAEWSQDPKEGLKGCKGIYIYEDMWDGSDLFRIERLGFVSCVTEKVARALMKVRPKLRNLDLRPNSEVWF